MILIFKEKAFLKLGKKMLFKKLVLVCFQGLHGVVQLIEHRLLSSNQQQNEGGSAAVVLKWG